MSLSKRVGALTIGQSPRPDLVAPLRQMLPDYELLQAGALDHLTVDDLPEVSTDQYPLTTRLRTGTLVKIEEQFLAPYLQSALHKLESQGVAATLLLCAGTFNALKGQRPLFKPFDIARTTLQASGIQQIGVICPIPEQERAITQRWSESGFQATVWATSVDDPEHIQTKACSFESIILDYVGHSIEHVLRLQRTVSIPVIDLGYLAMSVMTSTL